MPTVGPPPFLGPLEGVPVQSRQANSCMVYILRVNRVDGSWGSLNWYQPGWDTWPAGYYASAHLDIDGNVDWGIHSTVVVVNARTDQNGVAQPFVLQPAPAGTLPTPDCPPGMYNTKIGDLYGEAGDMCALASQPSQQICPPGTHWDPATETCVADTIPLPPPIVFPPLQPPTPPPETGQPDPQGDEITYELCLQMAANANAIIYAINQLGQSLGPGGAANAACCANVVIAIGSVTNTLGLILKQLITMSASAGAPLDLTQIVTELTSMAASLNALATAPALDLTPLTVAINDVARAIASAAPTDVSGIVEQLKQFNRTYDVSPALIENLKAAGYIAPKDAGFFQGMPPPDAAFATSLTGWHSLWRGIVLGAIGYDIDTGARMDTSLGPAAKWLADGLTSGLKLTDAVIEPVLKPFIEAVAAQIKPLSVPPIGGAGVDLDKPVASVLSIAGTSALSMYVLSFLGVDSGESLHKVSELIEAAIGWEQLRDVQIGPLVTEGLSKIAHQQARALFQQDLPGSGTISSWVARGLMTSADAAKLYPLNGLHNTLAPIAEKSAFHGMSPRIMLRLIDTGLFTDAEIADELTFSGMRPASQHRMIVAAGYLSTQPQRHQLQAAYEAQYRAGLLDQAALFSLLDAADHNTNRNDLILRRVNSEILVDEAKLLIVEYAGLFKGGVWSDATYRAQLAGLGLQQWKIDLEAGKAEAAANVATFKKNLAEAAALERATVAEERKAAMEGFKSGALNAAGLAAALSLTGLTPTQSAAWVSLAGLQQSGALRWIYGLLKSPAEAGLLRARVSALADQRKRLEIEDPAFTGALQAMGIPDRYINALRAATDALITPKTAAVTIPVQTT
jgi:hypothetical protein